MRLVHSGFQADLDNAMLFLDRHDIPPAPAATGSEQSVASHEKTYSDVLSSVRARAQSMATQMETAGCELPEFLLSQCEELSAELVDIADATHGSAPLFDAWKDELMEASDKIVLLSMESDESAVENALAIMLQLARDAEQRAFY